MAWRKIHRPEYDDIWDQFCDQFEFNPSVHEKDWPSIHEPHPSYTFDLMNTSSRSDLSEDSDQPTLELWLLGGIKKAGLNNKEWLSLDWQHQAYAFDPNSLNDQARIDSEWQMSAYPDGDYYIISDSNLRNGFFGHPWEVSGCLWGVELTAALPSSGMPFASKLLRSNLC